MQYRGQDRVRRLSNGTGGIAVELTDGQYEPLGLIVGHLYYSNSKIMNMIGRQRDVYPVGRELISSGYPHNGGEHTMSVYGPKGDVVAFLELASEFYTEFAKKRTDYLEGATQLATLARQAAII